MDRQMQITGMTCAACSARVEKAAKSIAGVENVHVNLLTGMLTFQSNDEGAIALVSEAVIKAGYGVKADVANNKPDDKKIVTQSIRPLIVSFVFLLLLMYFSMGKMLGLPMPSWYAGAENMLTAALLQFFLTLPVVLINAGYYRRGFKALLHGGPNMDTLIAVGSAAAIIHGVITLFQMAYFAGHQQIDQVALVGKHLYFESAAMILTLVSLGKYLESRAKGKAGDAIEKLMNLRPKSANVIRDGIEVTVGVEEIAVGDIVVLRSGEHVAVDGTVLEGTASIDQSAITGESVPVDKAAGDPLVAATVCTHGYLTYKAVKVGKDTTLSQIIQMVEQAGGSKAPIARLADKVAGIFVPVVMGMSLVAFIVWLLAGYDISFCLNMAISVLVISCPCALGLATPVAIMVATGRGAGMGILFRNAESLELLHKVDTVVMDKTGTLTVGRPEIVGVCPGEYGEEFLLQVAGSLEQYSEHLFAKAVTDYTKDILRLNVEDFSVLPGHGVSGTIGGVSYFGGNRTLMEKIGVSLPDTEEHAAGGITPLFFASDEGVYLGCLLAADVLKPDATAAVAALNSAKIDVVMLTGDNAQTASTIAKQAGITHVISDVLPQEKANAIKSLRENGKNIAMVGDGINDAPALTEADVGIAMGSGTDIAMDSAGVVIIGNDLCHIHDAIMLSKATMRNIRQNLFWAFFYNALGIPLAAGVLYPAFGLALSPMIGAAAMSLSSVFVVSNALRLRFFNKKRGNQTNIQENPEELQPMEPEKIILKVYGMMCSHCKAKVESVCRETPGTIDAQVDLQAKTVTVSGSPSREALKQAIMDAGYEVEE